MRKKGFVISFSTLLILMVMVFFAVFYSEKVEREEVMVMQGLAVEKAGFVADDLVWDLNKLIGIGVDINRGEDFTLIHLSDVLPSEINAFELNDWNAFVDGNYGTQQKAEIELGLDELVDGKIELVFSNGLQFDHSYADSNYVHFFRRDGSDTGVTAYDINVDVSGATYDSGNSTPWTCDNDQDVNVNLLFNGSVSSDCKQDPTGSYSYEFAFQGISETLTVEYGNISSRENSVKISTDLKSDVSVKIAIAAELPSPGSEIVWYYNADLNYSQGDVNVNRKFELGRA